MKAVIVTGDRRAEITRWKRVVEDALIGRSAGANLVVIHGNASGIDSIANSVCVDWNMTRVPVPAQWERDGKAAGPQRNRAMLRILRELKDYGYDVEVLAFHEDLAGSKGTKNMVNEAVKDFIPVWVHTLHGEPYRVSEVIR